jgi:hypothetical protein
MSNVSQSTPTPHQLNREEVKHAARLAEAAERNEPMVKLRVMVEQTVTVPLGMLLDTSDGISNALYYAQENPKRALYDQLVEKAGWAIQKAEHRKNLVSQVTAMYEVGRHDGLGIRVNSGDPYRPTAAFDYDRGVGLVEEIRAIEGELNGAPIEGENSLAACLLRSLEKAQNGTA